MFVVKRLVRGELPNESFDTFALTPSRFYSQMGFDIARGQPLPLLVYEAACGHEERLAEVVRDTLAWKGPGQYIYCHRGIFELLLRRTGPVGPAVGGRGAALARVVRA